jgi:two-component system nitrate/nitrite response regulator NarL
MQNGRTRVLVADGTRIHTELLAASLKCDSTLEIFTPAADFANIVESAVNHKVDVAVISSRLGEEQMGGLEALRKIRVLRPKVRGVILLDSSKPETILAAFRAGARGLFSRDATLATLSDCVRRVHAGEVCANSEQMAIALEALTAFPILRASEPERLNSLSKRELDVVFSLAEGLSNREIADRLGLSQHTVKNYLFRVFDKLGVSSRTELLFLTLNHSANTNPPADSDGANSGQVSSFASSQRAAEEGMPKAQIALARMYAEGKGVQKDILSAYIWYLISERNVGEMRDFINAEKRRMAGSLTTEEILEAQKLAAEHPKKPVQASSRLPRRLASANGQI